MNLSVSNTEKTFESVSNLVSELSKKYNSE